MVCDGLVFLQESKLKADGLKESVVSLADAQWENDKEITECRRCQKPFNVGRRKVMRFFSALVRCGIEKSKKNGDNQGLCSTPVRGLTFQAPQCVDWIACLLLNLPRYFQVVGSIPTLYLTFQTPHVLN